MELLRKIGKGIRNIPVFFQGYNIYVNPDKLKLIDNAFNLQQQRPPESFMDLGGVWKVESAYTIHTLKKYKIKRGYLVDTNFTEESISKLEKFNNLRRIEGNFGDIEIIDNLENVDIIYFFDVLLHQVNPNWDEILEKYSKLARCFVIYNQQYIDEENTIRLTDQPLERYVELAPKRSDGFYEFVYSHSDEINPEHEKPWKDIHNIWQWGITDKELRKVMDGLGFTEVFYNNYGRFSNLKSFENHGFIFIKK